MSTNSGRRKNEGSRRHEHTDLSYLLGREITPVDRPYRRRKGQAFLIQEIIDEFKDILLRDKFQLRLKDMKSNVEDTVQKILEISEIIEPSDRFDIVVDKSDNKFLDCAYEAKASFIISGDSHLLDVKEFRGIKIMTVNEFLERFKNQTL